MIKKNYVSSFKLDGNLSQKINLGESLREK
jgi:hypothetical protein